ncbi:protein ALP1-like [Bufo gargarizans]|uniref:protein ALP1-like n=1 Tax=Bufo gargarizans TaxID=30331 RepID=UPI001CF5D4CA|nr:protein ALP1-like [Bufo gargarizans]
MIWKLRKMRMSSMKRRRRYWVHPITSCRMTRGVYSTLYQELRKHPVKFAEYLRVSVASFDDLSQRLRRRLRRKDTKFRRSVTPEERLMVTLRFLASGESFSSLHFQFRLGKSTISYIVKDTCRAIWNLLREEFLPHPTCQQWISIADKFYEVTQFPNCIGAVDGKHVRLLKPPRSGSSFFNYKKYFSVILMAIVDANYKFVAVDIGAFGRTNDSRVFKNSNMGKRLYSGNFGIPEPRPLPGTTNPALPFVLVGDEAFQMCGNLLKPYASRGLDYRKRVFNYRLTRARRMVECAFGILTAKWRIFTRPIQLKTDTVDDVIKACVVLHNYVLTKEPLPTEPLALNPPGDNIETGPRSTVAVSRMRDQFAEYFISSAGSVHWQDEHI